MIIQLYTSAYDNQQTLDTETRNVCLFEFPNNASGLLTWRLVVLRISDGVTRSLSQQVFYKKISGVGAVQDAIPTPANDFASAGDAIALSGVSIALYDDGTYLGLTVTGIAGSTLDWFVAFTGEGLQDS